LIILRLAVIAGLILFLLGIERRNRQRITRPSEVAVIEEILAGLWIFCSFGATRHRRS